MRARTTRPAAMSAPSAVAERIIRWQQHSGRHGLPWQGTRDPYRVWLSEVMLQQTQVATALPYYERFLARFADVQALAAASLDDVLALWSGLGYYSRARNLHRCAQLVVDQHQGRFPSTSAGLAELPGIGRSTAAAIAAFCFGERAAILDGNVKRVLCRVSGFDADLASPANVRALWSQAEALLPERGIEAYTQGLMDLGATVCAARRPLCDVCPLAELCVAKARDDPQRYPVKTRRVKRGRRINPLLWVQHEGRHWLVQRPPRGVWAGLWSLPEAAQWSELEQVTAGWPGQGQRLPAVQHALTHFDWTLEPLQWLLPKRWTRIERRCIETALGVGAWHSTSDALALGLPAPVRRWLES